MPPTSYRATATAYFVNTETREVVPDTPDLHFEFVRIEPTLEG